MFGRSLVIFLHGSGDNGTSFRTFLDVAPLANFAHRTFSEIIQEDFLGELLTPSARERRYSPAGGERMNVWFDRSPNFIQEGLRSREDVDGIDASWSALFPLMQAADRDNRYGHYFLGGFSMGGGCILHALRNLDRFPKLRGIFTIGSFLTETSAVFSLPKEMVNPEIPIIMMHGEDDELIRMEWGRATSANLHLRGYEVQFRTYEGVYHELHPNQLSEVIQWMKDVLIQRDGEHRGDKRKQYLEAKYDAMTEELTQLESIALSGSKAEEKTSVESKTSSQKEWEKKSSVEEDAFPFTVQSLQSNPSLGSQFRLYFEVPTESIPVLIARPVLACGSLFEIQAEMKSGRIYCDAVTSDPRKTAYEISRRLFIRLNSGSSTLNPCHPS